MKLKFLKSKGFTLIELLVVISIIGLLSSVVLASLNTARVKARDARRKADLAQIRTALHLYYDKNGHWIETGSGCGHSGNGTGYFNADSGDRSFYQTSIATCLVNANFLPKEIADPSGDIVTGNVYMKYHCTRSGKKQVDLLARLEGLPQSNTAADNSCCPGCDDANGMNYVLNVE